MCMYTIYFLTLSLLLGSLILSGSPEQTIIYLSKRVQAQKIKSEGDSDT